MDINEIKYELQNLISGKSGSSHDALIQTTARYLRSGKKTGPMAEEKHQNKRKETKKLIEFAEKNNLLISINQNNFISEGAEQKVYIEDDKSVIKLNDAIYYASWEDYFHNLLLHNYFFADTYYQLLGFNIESDNLYAVVKQSYISADNIVNLDDVRQFLENNGFMNRRRHDYFHPELGIIIEDLHDENVLSRKGYLCFIDTVFFIDPVIFWKKS